MTQSDKERLINEIKWLRQYCIKAGKECEEGSYYQAYYRGGTWPLNHMLKVISSIGVVYE